MLRTANFSRCKRYRYALGRIWDESLPTLMIIGLNPSTADAKQDDPTIRRCINFAKDWGYGRLMIANLFAFRTAYPEELFKADLQIGPANDRWLRQLGRQADRVLAAWGNDGVYLNRCEEVKALLPELWCLKLNSSGQPAHPLYQPKTAIMQPFADQLDK